MVGIFMPKNRKKGKGVVIRLDSKLLENEEISEIEAKKKYLKEYGKIMRQMERSELIIREMRLNAMMPAIVNDGMPHAHNNADLSSYAAMLDREKRRYMKYRYCRTKKGKEIRDKIKQLDSEYERQVLEYRYIRLLSIGKIAEKMKKSYRQILRIHKSALEHFIV